MTNPEKVGQPTKLPTKAYRPTPEEQAVLRAHRGRDKKRPCAPRWKVRDRGAGVLEIAPDHPDAAVAYGLLMEAIGTASPDFGEGILRQLVGVAKRAEKVDEAEFNFMLEVVKGVAPRDPIEALLAAQMAAVHAATMTFARHLANAKYIDQEDSAERAFNKLARTFAAQVEALKRYRSRGQQVVRVERVTVNEGGQAIVGNVTHGGRGAIENREATP